MSGKSQTIGRFAVFRPFQVLRTCENTNPQSSEMVGDKSGKSGAFLSSVSISTMIGHFFDISAKSGTVGKQRNPRLHVFFWVLIGSLDCLHLLWLVRAITLVLVSRHLIENCSITCVPYRTLDIARLSYRTWHDTAWVKNLKLGLLFTRNMSVSIGISISIIGSLTAGRFRFVDFRKRVEYWYSWRFKSL